jgi:RND family efflux transporter MFP subunit
MLMLLVAALPSCSPRSGASAEAAERKTTAATAPLVRTVRVEPEPLVTRIEASGTALAARESFLSCMLPGTIQEIFVKRGDAVVEGQALLKIDGTSYQFGMQKAQAGLKAAQSQAQQVEMELDKLEPLQAEGMVAKVQIDRLAVQHEGAKAQVGMALAGKKEAKKALNDSVLRAPYDGVITDIFRQVGESAPGMPLVKIMDASTLEVQVFLPEDASRWVHEGDMAEVKVESAGVEMTGEVIFVSDAILPVTHDFEVRIHVVNAEGKVKAGSFARVSLLKESVSDALLVPIEAVRRDHEDRPYVFVIQEAKAVKREVTLGDQGGGRIRVVSGIAPQELVVVVGFEDLVDGQSVTIEPAGR